MKRKLDKGSLCFFLVPPALVALGLGLHSLVAPRPTINLNAGYFPTYAVGAKAVLRGLSTSLKNDTRTDTFFIKWNNTGKSGAQEFFGLLYSRHAQTLGVMNLQGNQAPTNFAASEADIQTIAQRGGSIEQLRTIRIPE